MNVRKSGASRAVVGSLLLLATGALWGCDLGYPTSEWDDSDVDHLALSGSFALLGTHQDAPCSACHAPGNYALKYQPANNQDCQACHLSDFESEHGPQGYPTNCSLCHTPTDWDDGSFNHQTSSGGFDLWGPHADLTCTACHVPGSFAPRFDPSGSSDCTACHHLAASGGFVLWGPHVSLACTACHVPDSFAPRFDPDDPYDCSACH